MEDMPSIPPPAEDIPEDLATPEIDADLEQEQEQEDEAPKSGRLNLLVALIPVAFILGLGAGYLFWGRQAAPTARQAQNPANTQEQVEVPADFKRYDIPIDDDPSIGPKDAVITIVEFSDYECPFCEQWHSEVFSKLRSTYPDKVRLVYRDFPLPMHSNAAPAAQAANCANEQGAFWDYHDKLFSGEQSLGSATFTKYAQDLGLDLTAFEKCVSEGRYKAEVEADFNWAAELGVSSTPTFFLNGIPIVGAQPYEVFQQVIEKELAGEIPK